jgi:hypothetical protein
MALTADERLSRGVWIVRPRQYAIAREVNFFATGLLRAAIKGK